MAGELFSWDDIKADWSEIKEILERCYKEIPRVMKARQKTCRLLLKEVEDNLVLLDRKETEYKSNDERKDEIEDEMTCVARTAKLKVIEAESTIKEGLPREEDYRMGLRVIWCLAIILFVLAGVYVFQHFTGIGVAEPTTKFELWETGAGKGLEIVYWSLFGVLANLTYAAALHLFNRDFDKWSVGWYIAKIPQAPLITLVVVLSLMYTSVEVGDAFTLTLNKASIRVIIVVSFIMGFFSRRTYKLLTVVRDKIMKPPEGENKD